MIALNVLNPVLLSEMTVPSAYSRGCLPIIRSTGNSEKFSALINTFSINGSKFIYLYGYSACHDACDMLAVEPNMPNERSFTDISIFGSNFPCNNKVSDWL